MNATRNDMIDSLLRSRILLIMRGYTCEQLLRIGEAAYAGGIQQMEVTFDQRQAVPDSETARIIGTLAEAFRGRIHIGAGTVLSPEQVRIAHEAGAEFIVSPDTYEPVIAETRKLGLVSIPGAFTATEAAMAHRYGADFIKLFPNAALGAQYLKDLALPLSHIRFLAVGGVTVENIRTYEKAGAVGYGISSGIIKRQAVEAGDYDSVTQQARRYYAALAAEE